MILRLRSGETTVRRDDHHLQIGIDPPRVVIWPDSPVTRRAAYELEKGRGLTDADLSVPAVAALVRKLDAAGLLATGAAPLPARLVGPADLVDEVGSLAVLDPGHAVVTVVMATGPMRRDLVDDLIRDGSAHLVLSGGPDGWTVGPYVIPGVTACLRCADAEVGVRDPRRALVVEQYAGRTSGDGDPVGRALAVAYLVRELRMIARGERPTTWSSVVKIGTSGPLSPHHIRRHPACGCAWDIALVP
ncbi:hypothetical protein Back2_07470 [Nocardioides baekrokdamisoli]|uniref:Bacteriocin biosynthesis cyclodehydratase domain-containing protein n=1 Tax=Nocardioides baekrokdamisoli TaxID=1804624 RepID=A0A3G9IC23_9ACTN|nr:hypothetical protein [Nocardioides baekrokdamisoli]BBH16460.1 hypothetical protein Back2_07470 [Nocardioides baekrokdamisoli]